MSRSTRTTQTVSPLRWGVLGATSYMAGLFISAVEAAAGNELIGLASREQSLTHAVNIAKEHHVELFSSYAALIDSADIDAVYVPLPNSEHTEWSVRALEAGKHVLIEKPIAMRLADLRRIVAASESTRKVAMEAFMYRFHPQFQHMYKLLATGEIGDLRLVRASFAYPITSGSGNIRLIRELGGGATWDVGVYAVNVATTFFGREPETVRAFFSYRPGEAVETSAVVVLDFGEGRQALIDYSIDYGPQACYGLQGEMGSITLSNAWAFANEPARITVHTLAGSREETTPSANHYQLEVEAFSAAARVGGPPPFTLAESKMTLRRCVAVIESARLGGPVSLNVVEQLM